MSSELSLEALGVGDDVVSRLGSDGALRVATFRLVILLAQELRTLMDGLLRADGLTTQQAALVTVVDGLGRPSLSQAAAALGTTHQNVKQLATSLERKGFLRIVDDERDARVRRLETTGKSRAYWQRRADADHLRVLEWFADLAPGEAETLHALLARVERRTRSTLDAGVRPAAAPRSSRRAPAPAPRSS